MKALIEWSAWEMEAPRAYGLFHLCWLVLGIGLSVLLAWKLRKLSDRGHKALMLSVGLFLVVCEIYKQFFYYYHMGNGSYQWWIFPFQMCSVPMYLCILAPLLPKGRVQSGMYHFMMIYNLLGGVASLLEPSGLSHSHWTLTIHAFLWHTLLVFVGLYLGFSRRTEAKKADFRNASFTLLGLCAMAFCINLLLWRVSGGSVNMFFVGPANSSLIVFSDIARYFGWYTSTALYIPTMILGGLVVFLPFHYFKKKQLAAV